MRVMVLTILILLCSYLCGNAQLPTVGFDNTVVWRLDSVDVKELTASGEAIAITYDTLAFANTIDCIYPTIEISKERCFFRHGKSYIRPDTFDVSDLGKLKFRFGKTNQFVEFDCILEDKTMYLKRWYDGKDSSTYKLIELKYLIK